MLLVKTATTTKGQQLSADQQHLVLTGGTNWGRRKRGPFAELCCLGPLQCPGTTRHHGPKCHLACLFSLRYLPFGSGKRLPEGFHHLPGAPPVPKSRLPGEDRQPHFPIQPYSDEVRTTRIPTGLPYLSSGWNLQTTTPWSMSVPQTPHK